MFLVNSRYRCLAATPNSSYREDNHRRGHTLSRSYGANLPNSLTRVLSSALVFSTRPPVSVWSTVTYVSKQSAAFLGSIESITYDIFLSFKSAIIPTDSAYKDILASISQLTYLSSSLLCSTSVVQEYLPASHRLRLSATP